MNDASRGENYTYRAHIFRHNEVLETRPLCLSRSLPLSLTLSFAEKPFE